MRCCQPVSLILHGFLANNSAGRCCERGSDAQTSIRDSALGGSPGSSVQDSAPFNLARVVLGRGRPPSKTRGRCGFVTSRNGSFGSCLLGWQLIFGNSIFVSGIHACASL